MNSIGYLWSSAANTRSQFTVTFLPLTFQLLSARIRFDAPSDHRTKNSWQFLNAVSNLLATVLSVSLPQLSGIRCLPACGIFQTSLTSKPSSKLFFFNRHFHKSRRTMMCVCVGGGVELCLCLCIFAWMVCASALTFLDRKICAIQEPSIIIIIIIQHEFSLADMILSLVQQIGARCTVRW